MFKRFPPALVLRQLARRIQGSVDPRSLQFQLTVSIAALIAVGLGSVALWTSWQMQKILIASHKQAILGIGDRIVDDVAVYAEMLPVQKSVQRALENRSGRKLFLWVSRSDGTLIAASPTLQEPEWRQMESPANLAHVFQYGLPPQVYHIQNRDFIACNSALVVDKQNLGMLYIAQDITVDQRNFTAMVRTLVIATLIAMLLTILAIALYVKRSLRPLDQMRLMTKAISAEDLGHKRVEIARAPSEIRELADTFNHMLARLSEAWVQQNSASERQRQFVSNVSHELRTPLTIVRGYLQSTLRRSQNLSDSQQEALSIAATEAEHTIRLLQDLLDLARADDGYMPFQLDVLVLNDVVANVVRMAEQFSHRQITVSASSPVIPAYADPNRLQQVLVNLVENAIKYSEPPEPITIQLDHTEDEAIIQVCDRGPGIPLQQQSRIFERFYRLDEARTRSGGTGLGLSIVKTFVEGMGGEVQVTSQLGKGSTFSVTLPVSPQSI